MEMKVNLIKELLVFLMRNPFISTLECLESGGNHPVTFGYKLKKNPVKIVELL